jgi:hypothetical protein
MYYFLKIIGDIFKNEQTRPLILSLLHPMAFFAACLRKIGRPGRLSSGFP